MYRQELNKLLNSLQADGFRYLSHLERLTKNIPTTCGVYVFCSVSILDGIGEVVYVGKSDNFLSRLKLWHPVDYKCHDVPLCYIKPCDGNTELEAMLIKKYRPKFNSQHNQKARRLITYA